MARPEVRRRLIVNADDFGRSPSINEAVIRAHREGILTSASLMVNEPACLEAVKLAKENPRLGVGLHLALLCGRSALTRERIPGLINRSGEFTDRPISAGTKYYFRRQLRAQLQLEIAEQFERFSATGLVLDHVNGHLHIHMHPVVFRILMEGARQWGITRFRLTRDRFWLNARLAGGAWTYRVSHAAIYQVLARQSRKELLRSGIRFTASVFGLLQNGRVNTDYIARLLRTLPPGDSELYSHPSLEDFEHEFEALISPKVKELVRAERIELIRYQDL